MDNRKALSPAPTDYSCILIDREGNAIQENMGTHDISYFSSILQDGATKFDSIPADEFPAHYFNFVSYNQLHYKIPKQDKAPYEKQPILTGCLTRVTDVREFGGANRNLKVLRKLDIENLNGNVVELALWDDMARNFKKNEYDSMEKHVIIAVSSCKVSLYEAILQLSATPTTHYYLNPDIPHLEEFRSQYKAQQEVNPPLVISKERCHDLSREKMRNRFALSTLMHTKPRHLQTTISDGTTTAQFTFFTPNVDIVTGADCTRLVNLHDTPSPREFSPEILNLQGRMHIFQFHYNPSCEKGKIDFYFDDILDKPLQITSGTEPQTEAPGPKTPHLLSKETRHGETSASLDTPSQLTTGDVTIKTPPKTETSFLLKETPDISTQETSSESPGEKTHDEGASEEIPSKTTSKRPLFQDVLEEQKKKKKD